MTGRRRWRSPGRDTRDTAGGVCPGGPRSAVGRDVANIPCEVYHVMHLPSFAETERCGPCAGGVQEIEFGNQAAEGVIS